MEVNNNSKGVSLRGDKNDKPTQKIFGILDNFSKVLSIPAFLISLYVAINQYYLESGSKVKAFWEEVRTSNAKVHADNEILKKQLSDYLHLLKALQTKSIGIGTAIPSKNSNGTYCSKFKTFSNKLIMLGSQVQGTINQLRREYFYLVLSENYNAKKLSIPAWDHFSNEEVIDQWRIRLITIIINNNFIFSVVSWDCGKKPIELSNNTYKEFSHDINGSYKGLQKDYITLIVSSGNPIVNAFETLLKTNDINKIGSPY